MEGITLLFSSILKSIWKLIKGRRRAIFFLYLMVLISALLESFGIASLYPIVDILQNPKMRQEYEQTVFFWLPFLKKYVSGDRFIPFALITVGVLFFLKNTLLVFAQYGNVKVITDLHYGWMNQIFKSYLNRPYQFFLEHQAGDLVQRQLQQTGSSSGALRNLVLCLGGLTSFLSIYLVLCFVQLKITLILTGLIIPIGLLIFKMTANNVYQAGRQVVHLEKQGYAWSTEILAGIKQVKIFCAEDYFYSRLKNNWKEYVRHTIYNTMAVFLPRPVIETLAVMLGLGAVYLLVDNTGGNDAIPVLAVFAAALYRMLPLISGTSSQVIAFVSKVPAIEIVAHLLTTTPSILKGKKVPPFTTSMRLENVSFTFNKKDVVLQNLSLVFEYNKYYAIVGSSGCGKSTIVDLLTGFYKADQGNILIDGVDLKYSDIGTWLPQIGVISQDTFIFSGTIEDNICFGIDEKDRDLERMCSAARIAYADEFIEKMPNSYKTTIGERGYQISGGQRQRLAIARALYLDPPILIFDEATSALDPISEKKVQKAIESLHGQRTVITVAHRLSTVANADHIYVIDKGRLVEEGIHQNLRSMNGLYSQLCANQNIK